MRGDSERPLLLPETPPAAHNHQHATHRDIEMKLLRVLAFVVTFVGVASVASAQEATTPPRGNVAGFGSFAASASDGLDSGHGFGFSATYFFSPVVGVEGGFRRQSFDVAGTDENTISGGDLSANVITANVVVRMAAGNVQPYVSGGIAFFANSYTIDPTIDGELAEFNFIAAESIDNTVGFNIAGGVDFQASPSIGFFVEGRFTVATADTAGGLTDQITQITANSAGEQQLNVFTVNGGIRIFF